MLPPGTPPPAPVAGPIRRPPTDPSHPSGLSSDARTYATFTHLSAFAGAMVAFAFVGPLIMWLLKREEHPFLDQHGKEATNFNLSFLLYGFVAMVLAFVTLGIGLLVIIPVGLVFVVVWIVAIIQAAIAANRGQAYRYPLSIRFIT
jgi:uncharacterized protein